MTGQEQEVMAELYYAFTGEDTSMPAGRWNNAAAIELYKMIHHLKQCSIGMDWVATLPGLATAKGYTNIVSVISLILDTHKKYLKMKIDGVKIYKVCSDSHTEAHIRSICNASMVGL